MFCIDVIVCSVCKLCKLLGSREGHLLKDTSTWHGEESNLRTSGPKLSVLPQPQSLKEDVLACLSVNVACSFNYPNFYNCLSISDILLNISSQKSFGLSSQKFKIQACFSLLSLQELNQFMPLQLQARSPISFYLCPSQDVISFP